MVSVRAFVLAALAIYAPGAFSYEDDVHYGLTKWLALAAGVSPEQAEVVALGDKFVDGKALDAVKLTFFSACVGKDHVGSAQVQKHHFPGEKRPPQPPADREVKEDSAAARYLAEAQIANPTPGDSGRTSLSDFGVALHAYQDSFSHRGRPDVPGFLLINCDEKLAWGHPQEHGGWTKHDADLTYLKANQPFAVKMAEGTYSLLCEYRAKVQGASCSKPFTEFRSAVDRFVVASTKLAKWQWFSAVNPFREHFPSCDFLREINLNDGQWDWCAEAKDNTDTLAGLAVAHLNSPPEAAVIAESPAAFVRALLETWFVKRDVHSVAAFYLNAQGFRAAKGLSNVDNRDVRGAAVQVFGAWLRRDHGSVRGLLNLRGAALVTESRKYDASAAWPKANEFRPSMGATLKLEPGVRLVKYRTLAEAFYQFDPKIKDVFAYKTGPCKDGKGQCALAAGRLRKAPYETLLLELRRSDGRWQLVEVYPYVDH